MANNHTVTMKIPRSHLFTTNARARYWLLKVVEYITASYTNPNLFALMKQVAKEELPKRWEALKAKGINHTLSLESYYRPDEVASTDFYIALSEVADKKSGDLAGFHLHEVGEAFELLVEAGILVLPYEAYHRSDTRGGDAYHGIRQYTIHRKLVQYLVINDLLDNYLFGFNFIIGKYTNSVVKIEVRNGDDISLGTGWILDIPTFDSHKQFLRVIVTNDHVVADSTHIQVYTKDDQPIIHHAVERLLAKTGHDIAVLTIDDKANVPSFSMFTDAQLLEEVITIGYPSVPLSQGAYQLIHRGEINANVVDYQGNDLLIISARTAPGNSGSPVIDNAGRVIGMVTQEMFEKTTFEEKGITPYSACVPAKTLAQALMQADVFPPNTKELIELGLTEFPFSIDLNAELHTFGQPKL
jgi:hypothetical protein